MHLLSARKRLTATLLTLAGMLVGGSTPALAGRDTDNGSFPHLDGIRVFRPFAADVQVGTWVKVGGGWAAATADLRTQFENNVSVTMTLDGVLQSVFTVETVQTTPCGTSAYFVDYEFLHPPLTPGTHEALETWSVSADVSDAPPGNTDACFGETLTGGSVIQLPRAINVSTPN